METVKVSWNDSAASDAGASILLKKNAKQKRTRRNCHRPLRARMHHLNSSRWTERRFHVIEPFGESAALSSMLEQTPLRSHHRHLR